LVQGVLSLFIVRLLCCGGYVQVFGLAFSTIT